MFSARIQPVTSGKPLVGCYRCLSCVSLRISGHARVILLAPKFLKVAFFTFGRKVFHGESSTEPMCTLELHSHIFEASLQHHLQTVQGQRPVGRTEP